jgi:hypothetical protein
MVAMAPVAAPRPKVMGRLLYRSDALLRPTPILVLNRSEKGSDIGCDTSVKASTVKIGSRSIGPMEWTCPGWALDEHSFGGSLP